MLNIAYQDPLYTVNKSKGKYHLKFGKEYLGVYDSLLYALSGMDLHKDNSHPSQLEKKVKGGNE